MGLPPLSYNLRSLFVRWSSTLLTVVGIGATVAVVAGVLALQQGFARLYQDNGRDDVLVFLRPGATSEGESAFPRERAQILMKGTPEIALDAEGRPLASGEIYLAVRRRKLDGGETNVPIRGVEPETFKIRADRLRIIEGRNLEPGTDEVIVGKALVNRIKDCQVGQVIQLNVTPFRVVGVFACDGPFESEIWGDVKRMGEALERPNYSRVIAQLRPDVDAATVQALAERLSSDKRVPAKVMTERTYLSSQTAALSTVLGGLAVFLGLIMGTAAVFTGTNTMQAAISARTSEIGILLAIGFHPVAVFVGFMLEALLIGLIGGLVGCLIALPLNGVSTGTTNFQTFTEVAFAFRVTPRVLFSAVSFALLLGLLGGAWPAFRAARMTPTEALRRG